MSGLPMLPETAPFPAEQIAALNRILPGTTAEQRTWLSGFLAGYQAATSGAQPLSAATPAEPARKAPLLILYATESGNTEALAGAARKAAARLGFAPRAVDMADTTPAEAAKAENLLVIASTWGEGEPPQRATDFYAALMAPDAPRFEGVRFAVLALGDRAYANFCETGRRLDERLAELGAARVAERSDLDVDYEAQADAWIGTALKELTPPEAPGATADHPSSVIHVDFARPAGLAEAPSRAHPFEAEITERVNLNGSRSTARTFHVELAVAGSGILYEPGDALGIVPRNDPALVEDVLDAAGLSGDAALHEALATRHDITTLTPPQVASYAALTGDKALADLAADPARTAEFVRGDGGRHLIDLLAASPHKLTAEQLTSLLRPLPPRLYSIASSRKVTPDEAHVLVSAVEYEAHGRARKGVASIDLAERRHVGDRMPVYLKPNPHFRLPADPAQPIVMVGPGTGVAPFRAFMQEREATDATGRNWLFFGNRHYTHDFLYQLEWQDLLKRGVLTRLDVAFSRDQPEKVYVQDRMWEARRDLFAWLQDGAALYVCGDANAMAKDVHATLLRIATDQGSFDDAGAQAWLDGLRRGGRYLRDVY